jgi:TRAP-type C4-dicarboxylate transport system permease small subunit
MMCSERRDTMRGRVIERLSVAADKVYDASRWMTRGLLWVGVVAGVACLMTTFVDVVSYKARRPILGAPDMVSFLLLITLAAVGSVTLINGRHLSVDVLVAKFPKRVQAVVESVVSLLSLTVSVAVIWYSILFGLSLIKSGDYSYTTGIPMYPFAFVVAAGFVPIAVLFFWRIVKAIVSLRVVSK